MITSSQSNTIADYYFVLLKHLNSNSKLDLISKLSQSLKEDKISTAKNLNSLFGAYTSEETAEDIIEEIKLSRIFNRNTESF